METPTTPGFAGNCGQSTDSADNLRTGNHAPDYGEPWKVTPYNYTVGDSGDVDCVIEILTREELRVAYAWNPSDENEGLFSRAVSCVNACAGMADPAAEIQAMREVVAAAEKCRHWHDCSYNPETGETEGVIISAVSFWELRTVLAKLKPFTTP